MTSVPDASVDSEVWKRELADAFEVLLGRPLDAHSTTAEYVFYTWNDEISFLMLEDFVSGRVDVGAIARGEHVGGDGYGGVSQFEWDAWPFDHGRSVWLLEEETLGEGGFGARIGAALRDVSAEYGSARAVPGADFARVLAAHHDQVGEIDCDELTGLVQWLQRVGTDGTLLDAMRAATWTMGGPDDLVAFDSEVEVDPELEEALRRVPGSRLRDHLRMLCLTEYWARSDGGYYLGPRECPHDLRWVADQPGHEVVAGWEFGEGQASSAVFGIK